MVTPEKTRTNEREFLALAAHALPPSPLSGPLRVRLAFFVSRARTKPKWWQVAALANPPRVWPRGRDVDNLAKQALDAMNGRFFVDDRQVVSLWATKEYSDRPRTVVVIEELEESGSAKEDGELTRSLARDSEVRHGQTLIRDLGFSVRVKNALTSKDIRNLSELLGQTETQLMAIRKFGETSLHEVKERLREFGLRLWRGDAEELRAIQRRQGRQEW